jgi:hypothetical protein
MAFSGPVEVLRASSPKVCSSGTQVEDLGESLVGTAFGVTGDDVAFRILQSTTGDEELEM